MKVKVTEQEERLAVWYWADVQIDVRAEFPTEEPADPEIGAGWYDPTTCCLCLWDGFQWVCVPQD